ncbi:MAG: hypothetical protein ACR2M1_08435 [Gemmatimonadaceae bacterium]
MDSKLTVWRFNPSGTFNQDSEVVETYSLAFGIALRETIARLTAIDPVSFHSNAPLGTTGSLRHVTHVGGGSFTFRAVHVHAGIATVRPLGRLVRRAFVIRPLPCEDWRRDNT